MPTFKIRDKQTGKIYTIRDKEAYKPEPIPSPREMPRTEDMTPEQGGDIKAGLLGAGKAIAENPIVKTGLDVLSLPFEATSALTKKAVVEPLANLSEKLDPVKKYYDTKDRPEEYYQNPLGKILDTGREFSKEFIPEAVTLVASPSIIKLSKSVFKNILGKSLNTSSNVLNKIKNISAGDSALAKNMRTVTREVGNSKSNLYKNYFTQLNEKAPNLNLDLSDVKSSIAKYAKTDQSFKRKIINLAKNNKEIAKLISKDGAKTIKPLEVQNIKNLLNESISEGIKIKTTKRAAKSLERKLFDVINKTDDTLKTLPEMKQLREKFSTMADDFNALRGFLTPKGTITELRKGITDPVVLDAIKRNFPKEIIDQVGGVKNYGQLMRILEKIGKGAIYTTAIGGAVGGINALKE